jgi:hypothetical protein
VADSLWVKLLIKILRLRRPSFSGSYQYCVFLMNAHCSVKLGTQYVEIIIGLKD